MIKRFDRFVTEDFANVVSTVGMTGKGESISGYPVSNFATSTGYSVGGGDTIDGGEISASSPDDFKQSGFSLYKNKKRGISKKDKKERLNNQLGSVIDELDRPVRKVTEARNTMYHTIVIEVNDRSDCQLVLNEMIKIKKLKHIFKFSYNESIDELTLFPNWLIVEIKVSSEIYVNYWSDHNTYDENLPKMLNWFGNGHIYSMDELLSMVREAREFMGVPLIPDYTPRSKRIYEGIVDGKSIVLSVEVNNKKDIETVLNKTREIGKIGGYRFDYNDRMNRLTNFPNWLDINISKIDNSIYVNYWSDEGSYEGNLQRVTDWIINSSEHQGIFHMDEFPNVLKKVKQFLGIPVVPDYTPKSKRIYEDNNSYQHLTTVIEVKNMDDVEKVKRTMTKIRGIDFNYNKRMDNITNFPNWLILESRSEGYDKGKLYINYWGDDESYEYNQMAVNNWIRNSISCSDKYIYGMDDLYTVLTKVGQFLGNPLVPNYTPRSKRIYEGEEALGASTTGIPGSGTAVGGGPEGSFVRSAGQALNGWDSGSAFGKQTNNSMDNVSDTEFTRGESPRERFKKIIRKKQIKDKKKRTYNKIGQEIEGIYRNIPKVTNEAGTTGSGDISKTYWIGNEKEFDKALSKDILKHGKKTKK